jgi:phage virion morphogenesis protein
MANPIVGIQYSSGEVNSRLNELQRKVSDLTPVMKNIGEYMLLSTDTRFRTETDPYGNRWQPNSPRTTARKRAEGRLIRVLQSTGRLRSSISYKADRTSVVIGTNVSYAAKHQLGQGVPKREFLGINEKDNQEILTLLNTALVGEG